MRIPQSLTLVVEKRTVATLPNPHIPRLFPSFA
jgi:hypothetical protein